MTANTVVDTEALAEHVARSRTEQGLPPRVEDKGTLRRIAHLLSATGVTDEAS